MSDHLRSEEFRQYVNKYIDKLAALCYWQGTFFIMELFDDITLYVTVFIT